jgi:hypothetical protein
MAKTKKLGIGGYLGIIPNMLEKSDRHAGFALPILPGMLQRRQNEKGEAAKEEAETASKQQARQSGMKKGGAVKSRGDGIAQRGKTKGRMC